MFIVTDHFRSAALQCEMSLTLCEHVLNENLSHRTVCISIWFKTRTLWTDPVDAFEPREQTSKDPILGSQGN